MTFKKCKTKNMKKLIQITTIMLLLTFQTFAAHPLRQALIDAGNKDSATIIYNTYQPSQKKIVWLDKINQAINVYDWNNEQIALLNQVKDKINEMDFELTTGELDILATWGSNWIDNAKPLFNPYFIRQICTMVMDFNPEINPDIDGAKNGCSCSSKSDFCISPDECDTKQRCDEGGACGFAWLFSCNGKCFTKPNIGYKVSDFWLNTTGPTGINYINY